MTTIQRGLLRANLLKRLAPQLDMMVVVEGPFSCSSRAITSCIQELPQKGIRECDAGVAVGTGSSSNAMAWLRRWLLPDSCKEDGLLLAAPKRKVTPSRKGNRSATKFVRFIPVVSQCSTCKRIFPQHAMPSKCEEEECPAFPIRKNPHKPAPTSGANQDE